jgi:inorganic phosphate transporter, PiT family
VAEESLALFVVALALGYVYAFVSGFTDAANAIATSVGSRVLRPRTAVLMAGVFNLLGGLTGTAVAVTIASGIIDPAVISLTTVVAGVLGAMTWSLFTYLFGIPVSETHGLIGGLVGAGAATAGWEVVETEGLTKTVAAIGASPVIGFSGGVVMIVLIYWIFHRMRRGPALRGFAWAQRASAAFMAFSHGRNDAQKPMGIIALAIALYYQQDVTVPLWIVVSAATVAAFGTAWGGWRIIRTLGMRVTELDPVQGFAAETSAAGVIQIASQLGIPISTTHAITSAIVGVGVTRRLTAVRWGVTGRIGASWVLTLPAAVGLGALYLVILRAIVGG